MSQCVTAEEDYFSILTGESAPEPLPDGPVPLDKLAERVSLLGPLWGALAQDANLPNREVTSRDGRRKVGAVPMAQAIHHANDHRTQILSILDARGLEVPDLDVWSYAESAALMEQIQPAVDC